MSKTIGRDFTDDIRINRFKLDEENEIQSSLHSYYGSQQVEAEKEWKEAKDNLDLVYAQRDIHYRKNPPDDIKVTEATAKSLVEADAEVQKAKEKLRVAEHALNTLNMGLKSIDMKRSALNNLTELFTKDYYNGSRQDDPSGNAITSPRRGNKKEED